MCVSRNQRLVKQDAAYTQKGIDDIHGFCSKFEKLVESDLVAAFNLERV